MALVIGCELGARLAELHGAASATILFAEHKIPEQAEDGEQDNIRHDARPPWDFLCLPVVVLEDAVRLLLADGVTEVIEEQLNAGQTVFQCRIVLECRLERAAVNDEARDLFVFKRFNHLRISHRRRRILLQQHGNCNDEKDKDDGIEPQALHFVGVSIQKYMSLLSVAGSVILHIPTA